MLKNILGKKIGMTQIFDDNGSVVPVSVIDVSNWFVMQIKTVDKDGYSALQLGLLKKRYRRSGLASDWLKEKKRYFSHLKEVLVVESVCDLKVGVEVKPSDFSFKEGSLLSVAGTSRGLGFQGVVKRWNFAGGPASHGSTFHRIPGSAGGPCSCGRIVKGKKMPGQCGNKRISVQGLRLVRLDQDGGYLFVKGAVPGKKESLLFVSMQG